MPNMRIILGLMTFGPDVKDGARVTDLGEFKKALDLFQSYGYDEVDTARLYCAGTQEGFTRLADWQGRGLTLATKVYPTSPGMHKPEVITELFNTSLKELGTDCVDIFYLHAADRSVPFAETLGAVDALHKQGKFKRLGLSNFTAFEVAEVALTCQQHGWVRPSIYQGMYNIILRSIEAELLPACRRYGLDVVVYNPIAGGLLSGKIPDKDTIPSEGRFSNQFNNGMARQRYFRDGTFAGVDVLRAAADAHGLTMIEIALRWLVHHSQLNVQSRDGGSSAGAGHDGIIIGASSYAHLESNLKDLQKGPLPPAVLEAADEAWRAAKVDTPPYWHLELKYTYDAQKALFGTENK
ncbi:aflatoxin B1 aldehyde reductase member 3 [Niveomyces insectorum RCEF 264]|uniref:Aflatoxin B1 aldehyde reductase member 3 n=1 Tax=Niveomyces insectorum RCEF 264 TaxID=1081102 RepID=A0A167YZ72_9HYPO|nr:aflatoxin B1 aldehyde reductase member 3 [Niveomyces insectorum RCEF 264]